MKRIIAYASFVFVLALMSGCGGRAGVTPPVPIPLDTSFEPADWPLETTDFTLGTAPDSAHFTGGVTRTINVPNAYRSGIASWGILNPGAVGTIDFDNPASMVSFYAVNKGGASGTVDVFDQSNVFIVTIPITEIDMMNDNSLISFTAKALGVAGISKVTVTNSNVVGHQVWIDDFASLQPMP